VKIFVIVYREVEAALTCNSQHTKHALQGLCPEGEPGHGNIVVMRHPDHNVLENAADMSKDNHVPSLPPGISYLLIHTNASH
jgi:phospholipase D1/2